MPSNTIIINLDTLRDVARRAYHNISFSPERRAESTIKTYTIELTEDVEQIGNSAPADFPPDDLTAAQQRYIRKYTDLLRTWLFSLSNTASSAIVGPANFPAEQMRKRHGWANSHYGRFRVWRTRAMTAIIKGMQPKRDELRQAQQRLASRIRLQRVMIATNKLIRSNAANLPDQLTAFGFSAGDIARMLTPDHGKRRGFKPFQLSNNSADIRRLTKRVRQLEQKQRMAQTVGTHKVIINGITLVQNFEADRIQIVFPDDKRPDKKICHSLRKAGFVFSPTNKAWQRRLTQIAATIARSFLEKLPPAGEGTTVED